MSVQSIFNINVTENHAPIEANKVIDQKLVLDEEWKYKITDTIFSDSDGDNLTY